MTKQTKLIIFLIIGMFGLRIIFDGTNWQDLLGIPSNFSKVLGINTVYPNPTPINTPTPMLDHLIKEFDKILTPTLIPAINKPLVNTVAKITCIGPDGKQFHATQKECDEFNAVWGNVNKLQQAAPQNGSNDQNATLQGFPCTVCYGSENCSTYYYLYHTKKECDAAQPTFNSSAPSNSQFTTPPTSFPLAPSSIPKISYEDYKIWCEAQINPKYDSLIRGCPNIGEDSSATKMCEYAYNQERQKELNKCLQQY